MTSPSQLSRELEQEYLFHKLGTPTEAIDVHHRADTLPANELSSPLPKEVNSSGECSDFPAQMLLDLLELCPGIV